MADPFVTLGAFGFRAYSVVLGAVPRSIVVNTNCLAAEPVQTVAYVSGFMPVTIEAGLIGRASSGETAAENLTRLRANLATEVEKDSNVLTIDWPTEPSETYRVFMNDGFDTGLQFHVPRSHYIAFTLTLNCLPT